MGKLTTPIPQDKIGESFVWREWFQKLSDKVFGTLASQDANAVEITGGTIKGINFDGIAITNSTIDSTRIGSQTPSTGIFSTIALLNPLGTVSGGTNISSYAVGDILYCSATNVLSKLAKPTDKAVLEMTSAGVPSWKIPKYGAFHEIGRAHV